MKSLNIGVVGYGLVGKKHCEIISQQNNTNLIGVVENNKDQTSNFSKSEVFTSIKEILTKKKIDGAIIASPSNLHIEHALEFIEKDIPLLIEKPISHSSAGVTELLKLAEKKSVPILVGHHRRYNQIIKSAKKIIDEDIIGKIRSIMSVCWFYKPDSYFNVAEWKKKSGAGPISINLIHDLDLMRYFCGEIENVNASIAKSIRGFENEDTASILIKFKSGVLGTMSVSDSIVSPWSWEMNSKENLDFPFTNQNCYLIGGSKGSLSIPDLKIWSNEKEPDWLSSLKNQNFKFEKNDPFVDQIQHFVKVINKEEQPIVSGGEAFKSLKAIEAIKQSGNLKKTINL